MLNRIEDKENAALTRKKNENAKKRYSQLLSSSDRPNGD
jgi:hypothetical protein